MSVDVDQLVRVIRQLPDDKISEVLDFARFLAWQQSRKNDQGTAFEQSAEKLAQEPGFADLTEDDVANIVHTARRTGR